MNHTTSTKEKDITRNWHLIDAKGKVLGRVAVEIAHKLMGKGKPAFVKNLDCGDHVVVINANDYHVTGKKETDKMYGNYSGYPGGLKEKPLRLMRKENPTEPLRKAVYGMLPKNKLRHRMITRLYLSLTEDHPYKEKFV
jgi:large subunit ribosomal protein L13